MGTSLRLWERGLVLEFVCSSSSSFLIELLFIYIFLEESVLSQGIKNLVCFLSSTSFSVRCYKKNKKKRKEKRGHVSYVKLRKKKHIKICSLVYFMNVLHSFFG